MRYARCFTSRMNIRHGSTTSPTVSESLRPHTSWRRYVRLIFPHSTASNRRADSGVTEATGRLLPALAPPAGPASTSHAAVRCHRAHAASRLASLEALPLGSHQMARLTRRSRRFTTSTDQPGRGVLLNADLGSLCLPIHRELTLTRFAMAAAAAPRPTSRGARAERDGRRAEPACTRLSSCQVDKDAPLPYPMLIDA